MDTSSGALKLNTGLENVFDQMIMFFAPFFTLKDIFFARCREQTAEKQYLNFVLINISVAVEKQCQLLAK